MSTTTYARPLYTAPDVPPNTKSRFAARLAIREAAHRAFDKAMSVPRSAIRWAIGLFHRWVEAAGSVSVFSWLGQQARNAAGLIRATGVVPVALAVLSTPPIAAAAARGARFVGRCIVHVAKAAWGGIRGLLGRCGNTGTRIVEGLSRAGTQTADAVRSVAQSQIMFSIVKAVRATLALVRPVSQGVVSSRLLTALVPIAWLRAVIGLLLMPFVVDPTLVGNVRDWSSTPPAEPRDDANISNGNGTDDAHATGNDGNGRDGTQNGLPIDAFDPPVPTEAPAPTNGKRPTDGAVAEDPPMNRASRRAQQRDEAQARRTRPRR